MDNVQKSMLRTAAQQALEALEGGIEKWRLAGPAIDSLRAALAEPVQEPVAKRRPTLRRGVTGVCSRSTCECEKEGLGDQCIWLRPADPVQEPVAWMYEHDGMVHDADNPPFFTLNRWATPVNEPYTETPLYTAPTQRKPLNDLAIADIYTKWDATPGVSMADFARAIERAHGIGARNET